MTGDQMTSAPGDEPGTPRVSDDGTVAGEDRTIPITLVEPDELVETLNGMPPEVTAWAEANGFTGKLGQVLRVPDADGFLDQVLIGWGDGQARARDRFHLGEFSRTARAGTYRLRNDLDAEAAEEARARFLAGRVEHPSLHRAWQITLENLHPGILYKLVVEAIVSVKTTLESKMRDPEYETLNRRTTHVMSKPVFVRTRAPCEPPRVLVTGYTQNTIQLYWERPLLYSVIGKDAHGNPQYLKLSLES